jgi:hypothetical protein
MPTEYHMEPTKVYYTYGPHTPALTVRSGDRVITTTVDSRNWNKDREQIPGSMRQSDPNTQFHYGNQYIPAIAGLLQCLLQHRQNQDD